MLEGGLTVPKYQIYDEDYNCVGEFVGDFVKDAGHDVSSSFDDSIGSGFLAILCLLVIRFPWLILAVIGLFILKTLWIALKAVARVFLYIFTFAVLCLWWLLQEAVFAIWWIVRVPFALIRKKKVPEWWFPVFWVPEW